MAKYLVLKGQEKPIEGIPEVIKILPIGLVHSQKGNFHVDEESFQAMKSRMESRGLDIVIDYEHQTLQDVQAPAGGWVKELRLSDDAIEAKVEWTEKAKEYLANKEYRYLSPVVLVRKKDNKAMVLHSVALTNTPAIDGMFPVINSLSVDEGFEDEGGNEMDLKALAALLGLPEDATEEAILAKVKELAEAASQAAEETVVANKVVLGLLGLPETAKTEDCAAAIIALKNGSGSNQVSASELKALKEKMAKREADEMVELALKAGKITAAQKEWATEYALSDPTGFGKFTEKAPQAVPMGELGDDGNVLKTKGELDEAELKICKMLGISKEDQDKYLGGDE